MARIRSIKPGYFLSDELAELPPLDRILFAGLWVLADREGRLEDRIKKIKAEILPYDDHDVDEALSRLADKNFIQRYEIKDCKYIQILNFLKHQCPNIKEHPSIIPAPYKNNTSTPRLRKGKERKGKEQERKGKERECEGKPKPASPDGSLSEEFDQFWQAYPKKKSKGQAEKAWLKIKPNEQLLATILAKIEQARTSEDWTKDGGKYIPHPATWLNAEGWHDEYKQPVPWSDITSKNLEAAQRVIEKMEREDEKRQVGSL